MRDKKLGVIALLFAFAGFLDATYLAVNHYNGAIPTCTTFGDCEKVLSSAHATVGFVPLALIGVVYYVTALLLGIAYIDFDKPAFLHLMVILGTVGFCISVFLIYLQIFQLQAICAYCMVSALCSTAYAILSVWQSILAASSRSKSA